MKKNVEAFIYYGINRRLTVKQARQMIFWAYAFYIIGIIYGMLFGMVTRVLGVAALIITIVFTIYLLIKSKYIVKDTSYNTYFLFCGALSLETTINFQLLSIIFGIMTGVNTLLLFLVFIIPLTCICFYVFFTKKHIEKGVYLNLKEIKKKNIMVYSAAGGAFGISIARTLFSGVDQYTAGNILILCFLFISSVFSLGIINYLKYYYQKTVNKE